MVEEDRRDSATLSRILFLQKIQKVVEAKGNQSKTPPLLKGAFLSSINMLALPYYFGSALALDAGDQITALPPFIYFMAIGVFLGGFMMFSIYSILAEVVAERSAFVTKNLNIMLSILFTFLGLAVLVNLVI